MDSASLGHDDERRAAFEQRIVDGEKRLTRQMLLVERLRAKGRDVGQAERFLHQLSTQLKEWISTQDDMQRVRHRYEILCNSPDPS